ncbi:MAG: phosphopentomutase [Candidatus Eremiobacteraeota bacterium]|nr:phosphopentomutase [Candidatus Eremiobacteraeota bacterium]
MKRAIIIVMDGVGAGEMPDAGKFGDEGSNTLGNIAKKTGGLDLPNFQKWGLGNITFIEGIPPAERPEAFWGKMAEASNAKDTTIGHWEIAGIITEQPFPTYPDGFPPEIIEPFESAIGKKILGNKAASGTEIIKELGEEHIKTGYPIVYTSADSVFQIAAHEDIIPVEKLYEICEIARNQLRGKHNVGRVIARPFIGEPGNFTRTDRRHDYSVLPPVKSLLDYVIEAGLKVFSVGKIKDIFAGQGISENTKMHGNPDGIKITLDYIRNTDEPGLIFTNLVDFDMLYGHRNDPVGFKKALEVLDDSLPDFQDAIREDDILFFTADHGCDPTTASTDHSREYVPLLVYGKSLALPCSLGIRKSFADIASTIRDLLGIKADVRGESFAQVLLGEDR